MASGIHDHAALWQQVKQGDRTAFDQVYHLYAAPIFSMVYKHIRSRADAGDITQEVFMDLWDKKADITIQSSLFNYLYSIARNRTLRYIKRNAARPESLDLLQELLNEQGMPLVFQEAYSASVIRTMESSVANEIAGLPAQMKKVYHLNQEAGMSVPEIAELLLISPNTVKNHLSKVRKRLRQAVSRLTFLFFMFFIVLLTAARWLVI
ncbi:RNA polymerase sigma-70 factor, ECF subfamily [Chitinophaga ginsengisegetis]|uniref:RNA polymerase sigma-70 factor, ECF subfamily n=1 Tax=Chitinophaga ginsengisegetis TaxID=393003 RepID=A0A1T5PBG8_9BACT|nr:sigma-70 family RNA polymerase sigma factor [Chitinophaga ginsengisegetis]MDR6568870.1 RNA polymerase sigma-70 factor (ECF subfamily) [Chitinophaga ginsengisegetis]MDR6649101.1 RNA polymerase sigma-70 factor (ECF subfamily) [Chitinophaga ginsengisegetis]MDR6654951.1 RNA polymerase sigma-70 factor (ECF subfamily) [Chitinophaga ginsengisegetis]SKD09599.1 RNA polymerase sigma-70 factor, ECF subfamily [Chitinophaga ginsengisegetis]